MNNLLTDSFEIPRGQSSGDGDIEMGAQAPANSAELGLETFFKQVRDIEKQVDKLSKLLKKLQDANEESKSVTNAPAMKAIKQRMEKDIDEVGKIARVAKTKLEELDKDNLNNRQKPGCGKGSGVDRSRTSTTVALKKKLKDKMSEFQALRETIQQEYREVVERRVYTVTGNHADEETIEQLIETGDSEQIFHKAIQEQGRGQIFLDIRCWWRPKATCWTTLSPRFQVLLITCNLGRLHYRRRRDYRRIPANGRALRSSFFS